MTTELSLQPDQTPSAWDDHVSVYEEVFEPLTVTFAGHAADALGIAEGARVLDVAAGPGAAAVALARRGAAVTAIDASPAMVARLRARAAAAGMTIAAEVMDGQALSLADASFDAALSVFGVILFPDAVRGLAEMRRVVAPGGRIAVVTWTQPQNYELARLLREASQQALGPPPPAQLPAQLRFVEPAQFGALFAAAGLADVTITTLVSELRAPSVDWLLGRLAFAPGMQAMLAALGPSRTEVIGRLRTVLADRFGSGPVSLGAVAALGLARVAPCSGSDR